MNQPLAETIFWVAAIACAAAEVAILRSIIAQRRGQRSSLVPAGSPVTELIWGVVPAIALAFLFVFTWRRVQQRDHHMRMDSGAHRMTLEAGSGKWEAVSGKPNAG
jgi:heme/copper-type cytochrome/quinol oxidase subunit 2